MASVTVLTSVHGVGHFLPEAMASIPWELPGLQVIVTANGADDIAAVRDAVLIYPAIVPIYRDVTVTLSDSLNAMLDLAAGDYMMRLDHDDMLITSMLAEMLGVAVPGGFVYSGYVDFGDQRRVVRPGLATLDNVRRGNPCGYNILVDTALARFIGGWEEVGFEDWYFLARLVKVGAQGVRLNRSTLLHRARAGGRGAKLYHTYEQRVAEIQEALA